MKKNLTFLGFLLLVLLIVFGIHLLFLQFLDSPLFEHKIVLAYGINYALAAIILFLVSKNLNKGSAQAGFLFLLGSALKFLVFFLVFNPSYKEDGDMSTAEFATFFVPYFVCLLLEVYFLSKELNNQTSSPKNSEEKKEIK
ncbi:DUF6168 family protein [Patiriisocius hiemis]|uniref:DUF6168 family protein n=1 Tax=Patiriisocius hiemis TaxID=3075604 RepID=A0ABU2YBJ5_9FLAO|nr:DUF6168 family protein [Constantimarinum sp. W242]MDT0555546.1 DUF6168 family protein [Constantimarinum sp. W242]